MPKMKTHRGAAKRFRATGSGKIMRKCEGMNHILRHKTKAQKRRLKLGAVVTGADRQKVKMLTGL